MAALKERAEQLGISSNVRFIGRVLPTEISNWLMQSDAGVLATRRDVFLDYSFSNKLTEYVIMGKPVIASELRTIRHYFSPGSLAYFEPHNPRGLAAQIVRVARDAQLRENLVKQARQEYVSIGWSVMKRRYLRLIAQLCGETIREEGSLGTERSCQPVHSSR
jgi:glycosyltransferase involved in cell wall biosynthesis